MRVDKRERCSSCGCVLHRGNHYGSLAACREIKRVRGKVAALRVAVDTWKRREGDAVAEAKRLAALVQKYEPYRAEVAALRRALDAAIKRLQEGYPGFALAELKAAIGERMVTPVASERQSCNCCPKCREERARVAPEQEEQ